MSCNCKNNYCEKRQRTLPPRIFEMCQGTTGLSKDEEELYLKQFDSAANNPGLVEKVSNFTEAVIQHFLAGFPKTSDEEYNRRLSICSTCEFKNLDSWVCSKCGCPMDEKARWAEQQCPAEPPKWERTLPVINHPPVPCGGCGS
jgi:hypothetical protein